jgi:hypothetical protein
LYDLCNIFFGDLSFFIHSVWPYHPSTLFYRFLNPVGITSISSNNISFFILFSHVSWRLTPVSPSFIEENTSNQCHGCYELCVCRKVIKNKFSAELVIHTFQLHRFVAQQIC